MSAVAMQDENDVFVSLDANTPAERNGIAILACSSGRFQVKNVIELESQPTIMALTRDGRTLVVPDDNYIAFVDTQRALAGDENPLIGYIEDIPGDDGGAVYATVSPDDRYALIAEEQSGKVTIVDLRALRSPSFDRSAIVSEFEIGAAPVALVFSHDGKYLFATVQTALSKYGLGTPCIPENSSGTTAAQAPGAVVTIDLAKAVAAPAQSIVSYVAAGCHPVRASLSPDGRTLWVAARASNEALAFHAEELIAGGAAKPSEIPVGMQPVPILATNDGRFVLVGNSNRSGRGGAGSESIDVIDVLAGKVAKAFPVGKFPRQLTQTSSGSAIFLCEFGSDDVRVIDPATL